MMAIASHVVARLLARYRWITWAGLLIVLWVALAMIWDGWNEIEHAYPALWSGSELWQALLGR